MIDFPPALIYSESTLRDSDYYNRVNPYLGLYPRHIDHYTKLTEVATTVQFVCHYWKLLSQKLN